MANDIDIEALAEAIVRKQNEAAEKKAAETAKAAEAEAKKQAEANKVAAEKAAKEAAKLAAVQAEAERVAAETKARIEAVLFSRPGDVFVDADGAEHRVVGETHEGVDTVSRDRDGGKIGNWRAGRPDTAVLATWRKKE